MATIPVVYNATFGGFDIPKNVAALYQAKCMAAGVPGYYERDDPLFAETVRELGKEARTFGTYLQVAEIPLEYAECYRIDEYDGAESVVCDPKDLIAYKLSNLDIAKLSDAECRTMLEELVNLASEEEPEDM